MKRIWIILIIIFNLIILLFFLQTEEFSSEPEFLQADQTLTAPKNDDLLLKSIEKINLQNKEILSFQDQNASIVVKNGRLGWKFNGSIAYKKEKNFRFQVSGLIGKALDLGSNDNLFWFWSKTMTPPHLFYSSHENTYKSRLKTPFHPLWMMESMSMSEINLKDVELYTKGNFIAVVEYRKSTENKQVKKTTLIDPQKGIVGHYINDLNGEAICSSEVKEWNGSMPSVVIINWHEEQVSIKIKFNDPQVNQKISNAFWDMPQIYPQIDMSKD